MMAVSASLCQARPLIERLEGGKARPERLITPSPSYCHQPLVGIFSFLHHDFW